MKRKRSDCYAVRPNKGMPGGRTTSAGCTSAVAACDGTAWKPSAGTVCRRGKEINWRRRTSAAFVDER